VAVKIKLKRLGMIRSPQYRIVVADSRTKRDGRAIEEIGLYHPKENPSFIQVNSERAQYWLGVGAQPTEAVAAILRLTGDIGGNNTLKQPEPKADKAALFEAALKDLHSELPKPKTKKAEKPVEEAPKVEEAPAAEAVAEEAVAEEAPAEEAAAEEAPAEEAAAEAPAADADAESSES